jgi:DNA-binding beta-propeller fold protein YncE
VSPADGGPPVSSPSYDFVVSDVPITVAGGHGVGTGLNQIDLVRGLAVDRVGGVYVADAGTTNSRVVHWTPGVAEGVAIGAKELSAPFAVAVDGAGDVYVADAGSSPRVRRVPSTGGPVVDVGDEVFGSPSGIALHPATGAPYVTDSVFGLVWFLNGAKWQELNQGSPVAGPSGLAFDRSGSLYIAAAGSNQVLQWVGGATPWKEIPVAVSEPRGLAFDDENNLYIADSLHHRVVRWHPGDSAGTTVAGTGSRGTGPNELDDPRGVVVIGDELFVADSGNHRVVSVWLG